MIATAEDRVLSAPKVARMTDPKVRERFEPEESRIVNPVAPPALFWIVTEPPTASPRLAIVYVAPAGTLESNATAPENSLPLRLEPAKVIDLPAFEVKRIGAAKPHDADVVAFVQLPLVTVQEPVAEEVMKAAAALRFTFPTTATIDVPVMRAPVIVSPPCAARAKLLALVFTVPFTVIGPVTMSAAPSVLVPALWVMA